MTEQAVTVTGLIEDATARIAVAQGLERREARLEAQILIARALGATRAWLVAHDRNLPLPAQAAAIEALVARREQGEPVAYILGEKEFYGRVFKVTPDVLIPRPETELLIEAALQRLPKDRPAKVLDLGTGSGCIAITIALERPDCEVLGADICMGALEVAKQNASQLGAANVRFVASDWYAQLPAAIFDMIVSNPPYVASTDPHLERGDLVHEPLHALASGPLGLDAIGLLAASATCHLNTGGWLLVEHGFDQGRPCARLFEDAGLSEVFTLTDFSGHPRITGGQWAGR